jgi:hypothetical protein
MTDKLVQSLASDVTRRLRAARDTLQRQMDALGLTAEKGWRVSEELHHTVEGTEWTFRPIHLRDQPSNELLTSVRIDQEGRLL